MKFDRDELTIWVERSSLREACVALKEDPACRSITSPMSLAWTGIPSEPRFEVVYHLFSIPHKERVRLKVKLYSASSGSRFADADLAGREFFRARSFRSVRRALYGHPNLRRIMMPEDWEGHPLRKDYPVEGYR